MSRQKSAKPTGAELRAMREQRAAATVDPAAEAKRREKSFLTNLANARSDYDWLINNQAWGQLGYDSLGDWYVARIEAPMRALGARPNPEVGIDLALRIYTEELDLPPMQRRSMAELATIAGVSESKLRRLVARSLPASNEPASDLASSSTIDGEFTEQTPAADQPAGNGDADSPSTSVTASQPDPVSGGAGSGTQTSGDQESKDAPVEDTPAGRTSDPAPDEGSPPNGQPGLETPAATVATSVPDADREQEESGEGASSPDSQNPFIEWVHDLVDVVGQRIDAEDGFTTDEDLKLLLRNAVADLQDHLGELEFVWMRDLAGEVSA